MEVSPEVRSTYVSLGKLMEDRPMLVVGSRVGVDAGDFGRFGIRNWEVSSLTDRRSDDPPSRRIPFGVRPDMAVQSGAGWQFSCSGVILVME